ncbi:MAG: hypothetical protein ACLFVC_07405 [Opitutales bacterium]
MSGGIGYILYLQRAALEGWRATDGAGVTEEMARNIAETVRREYPPKRFEGRPQRKARKS